MIGAWTWSKDTPTGDLDQLLRVLDDRHIALVAELCHTGHRSHEECYNEASRIINMDIQYTRMVKRTLETELRRRAEHETPSGV